MLPKKTLKLLKTICKNKAMPVLSYAHVDSNGNLTASDFETTIILPEINIAQGLWNPKTNAMEFIDISEYPSIEYKTNSDSHVCTVTKSGLELALKHSSDDESRYNLCSVAITSKGYCIGCDGHRAFIESRQNLDVLFLLSRQSAKILIEIMAYLGISTIELRYNKTHNTVVSERFKTRALDGKYPDISQILPKSSIYAELDTREAITAIKRAVTILKEVDRTFYRTTIRAEGEDLNLIIEPKVSPSERYKIGKSKGHAIDFNVNASFLLDAIAHIKGDTIGIETDCSRYGSPIAIEKSIVMPMK